LFNEFIVSKKYKMGLKQFLKSKVFLKHLILSVAVTFILIWVITLLLGGITHHGEEITVPDLTGLKTEEIGEYLNDRGLDYLIIDSIYDSNGKKGTVASQDPFPNSKVKSGRVIYVTVIAILPERVAVPDLKDLTLRQSVAILETYGLKTGKLEYVKDIARNAVLKQKYNGEPIEPGRQIEKGSSIDLVVGRGEENEKTSIPFLIGKTRNEAIRLITENGLNLGDEDFEDGADTANAKVYKQSPFYTKKESVSLGSTVNLRYKSSKKFDFKAYLKKIKSDTIDNE